MAVRRLADLDPQPTGFGLCGSCAYRETATPQICFLCAREKMEAIADQACPVCCLALDEDAQSCRNIICTWDYRYFDRNYAIALRSGSIGGAITKFKYEGVRGWGTVFARVLVGYLEAHPETFEDFDLITASPTFVASQGDVRTWDHTRLVLEKADQASEGAWPFDLVDPAAIIKTAATSPMMGQRWKRRQEIAETEIRSALEIPDSDRVRGKKILVYDDVFTDGFTLREVARKLTGEGGAQNVCGITLTRQPFPRRQ